MRRIVEKGMGQVKHTGDFASAVHSSKSTNICNEYGRSNVFITDPQQTFALRACTKWTYWIKKMFWSAGDGSLNGVSKK
jgi:hypothetical protein